MTNEKIKITSAKGRPMLHWVGKKPLDYIKSFPAQLVEVFDSTGKAKQIENPTFDDLKDNWQNLLFHGDNKEVLGYLLANGFRGKIDLIYIDPPFDSNADYIRRVELRGTKEKKIIEGEDYQIGEQIQYFDIWSNDNYLQFMYERLLLLKELLNENGSIFLHCDWHQGHRLKLIMDEVFGENRFINEIAWCYTGPGSPGQRQFTRKHETIYWYSKWEKWIFNENRIRIPYHETTAGKFESKGTGFAGGKNADLSEGKIPEDWWYLPVVARIRTEITGYPTQKPEELLNRIIEASSNEGDLILDAFGGCGTTGASAQKLNRRWIGCDINKGAIQTTAKRLQKIIFEQSKDYKLNGNQSNIIGTSR